MAVIRIYLDNNATTALDERVLEAMAPILKGVHGNPSSPHAAGREARRAVEDAREEVAASLGAEPSEIIFTSGATEANNLALLGLAERHPDRRHLLVSRIEHPSVQRAAERLAARGLEVTWIPVDREGFVDPAMVRAALRPDTLLVSVMWVNNEVGTIEPVEEVAAICEEKHVPFHCDAVQAIGKIPVDLRKVPIRLLTGSAHKIHGPKGSGFLYVRRGTRLLPQALGGTQERDRRAGTENVAGVVGLGKAVELAIQEQSERAQKLKSLSEHFLARLKEALPAAGLNGPRERRVPSTLNIRFPGAHGETLLMNLDLKGVAVSLGSACSSGAVEPSHVLTAMGLSLEDNYASLRFSLSVRTTQKEIDLAVGILSEVLLLPRMR